MRTRHVVIGLGVGLAALLLVGLLIGGSLWVRNDYHHGPGMMWNSGDVGDRHSFGPGLLMLIVGVPLLGLIVGGAVVLAVILARQGSSRNQQGETPLEILRRRYARGEIDREEFERMREILSGGGE